MLPGFLVGGFINLSIDSVHSGGGGGGGAWEEGKLQVAGLAQIAYDTVNHVVNTQWLLQVQTVWIRTCNFSAMLESSILFHYYLFMRLTISFIN